MSREADVVEFELRAGEAILRPVTVDFLDAYHAAEIRRRGVQRIYSYDEDFDRLDVRREEP